MDNKKVIDPYGEEDWNDAPPVVPKKRRDFFPVIMLSFMFLMFSTMMTTCAFHDKMKYENIREINVKMLVTNEVYKLEGRHGEETVFYLRAKSTSFPTPEPDYLLASSMCPSARKDDTIVCLVKYSNELNHKWYSTLAAFGESGNDRFKNTLFIIEGVNRIIKKDHPSPAPNYHRPLKH